MIFRHAFFELFFFEFFLVVGKCSDHLQLIRFWPSRAPGRRFAAGRKFLAPSYYSQRARCVCVSLSAFFHSAWWAIALLETRLCVCTLCLYCNCFCCWRNKYSLLSHSLAGQLQMSNLTDPYRNSGKSVANPSRDGAPWRPIAVITRQVVRVRTFGTRDSRRR